MRQRFRAQYYFHLYQCRLRSSIHGSIDKWDSFLTKHYLPPVPHIQKCSRQWNTYPANTVQPQVKKDHRVWQPSAWLCTCHLRWTQNCTLGELQAWQHACAWTSCRTLAKPFFLIKQVRLTDSWCSFSQVQRWIIKSHTKSLIHSSYHPAFYVARGLKKWSWMKQVGKNQKTGLPASGKACKAML